MKEKIFIFILSLFISTISLACPLCTAQNGAQVRGGIFNHDFLLNLFSLFLPFIFFILIALVIYYGLPNGRKALKLPDEPLKGDKLETRK